MSTPTPQLKAKLKKIIEAANNSENLNERANAIEVLRRICGEWDIELTPENIYSYGLLLPSSPAPETPPIVKEEMGFNPARTRRHHHINFG